MSVSHAAVMAIIGVSFLVVGAGPSVSYKGDNLVSHSKISLAEARRIALKACPGRVTDEELEAEKGGSGYRYSFDIKTRQAIYEVGVDAQTGKVLENAKEGAHAD